jgi:hypothetical protein
MAQKHNKLTVGEFASRIYPIWADKMSGRMTVPFLVVGALLASLFKVQYDFVWITFSLAVLFTSFKLVEEERDKLIALEEKIENKEVRQKAIDKLWELRSEGISLRNSCPLDPNLWEEWKSKYMEWRDRLLPEAEKVSPNLRQWLKRLDTTRDPPVNVASSVDVRNMSETLARLGDFLKTEMYEGRILEYLIASSNEASANPSFGIRLLQDTPQKTQP